MASATAWVVADDPLDRPVSHHGGAGRPLTTRFDSPESRTVARLEHELTEHTCMEIRLREALARDEALLRQKDEFIQQQAVLSKESDHRLLNGLQLVISLLSLQSRVTTNAEVGAQLAVAANRVATIERVHRRIHSLEGFQSIAFKQFLEDFCRDFSLMLSSEQFPHNAIDVE